MGAPAAFPDAFKGPPKARGIIGRLALEPQIVDETRDIVISIHGLSSESLIIHGESAGGVLGGNPAIRHLKTGKLVDGNALQNGVYSIRGDDLKADWDSLTFSKTGNSDRFVLTIESPFDYVERPEPAKLQVVPAPDSGRGISGWGLGPWGLLAWGG